MMNEKLSRSQAAIYLGIAPITLALWACKGKPKIPFYKVGRKCVYFRSDLDAFLAARRVNGPSGSFVDPDGEKP